MVCAKASARGGAVVAVSVIIPMYNAAASLDRAVESVLHQSFHDYEVILVNDGSQDNSFEKAMIWAHRDARVHPMALPRNAGVSHATNVGIRSARAPYIALLDADDSWHPCKLAAQVAQMEANPHALMCATASEWITAEGRHHGWSQRYSDYDPDRFYIHQYRRSAVALPSVMLRRSALDAHGLFDESLPTAQDQDMWLRVAFAGAVLYLEDVLTTIYMSPQSLTQRNGVHNYLNEMAVYARHYPALEKACGRAHAQALLRQRRAIAGRDLLAAGNWMQGLPWVLSEVVRGQRFLRNAMVIAGAARQKIRGGQAGA